MTTYTWISATSADWSTASDWSPAGGPGTGGGDAALFSATGSPYTVTYNNNPASLSIALLNDTSPNATIDVNTGKLTTGTLIAAGTVDVGGGATLAVSTTASISGALDISGSLSGGTASVSDTISLNSGAILMASGAAAVSASHALSISSGATAIANDIASITASSITVNGLLETTTGTGTVTFDNISGTGTIEANGGTIVLATGSLNGTAIALEISNSTSSVLDITSALYNGNSISATYLGPSGDLHYNNSTDSSITFKLSGLNVASGMTNFADLAGGSFTITSGGTGSGTSGTIVLSNGDTLALTGITNADSAPWYAQTATDGSGGTDVFLSSVCYAAGTRILTDQGERAVETLRPGDIVITLLHGQRHAEPVKWIGRRRVDLTAHPRPETIAPIRIRRGAIADDMPRRDLVVSPDHAILIDRKLVSARQLVNGMTIRPDDALASVDYLHVELSAHAILLAEGLPAESYLDTGNRGFFANCGATLGLHPDLCDEMDYPSREQASCEPFVWDEDSVRPIWQRLADRAILLGEVPPRLDTTTDPGLHLVVHGHDVKPMCADAGRHLFLLPKEASEVRVVSLAEAPTVGRPWVEDRRRLGVCVERIILRSADDTEQIPIPLDHPGLSQGWWATEREGMKLRRWTNGDATLRLPAALELPVLELHAGWDGMSYSISARPKLIATPARQYRHAA